MTSRSTPLLLSLLLPAAGMLTAAAPPVRSRAPARPAAAPAASRPAPDTFRRDVAPLVQKYCVGCHGSSNPPAGVSLSGFSDTASVLKARKVWENVVKNVAATRMPPPGVPQPSQAERDRIVGWIQAAFSQADCKLQDPGRVTMRRLNRQEYNNTVRDLLYVNLRLADEFPLDDVGYGFDNIGDVLSISPLLMEKYIRAAEKIARAAIVTPEAPGPPVRFEGAQLTGLGTVANRACLLHPSEETGVDYSFPKSGDYVLRARVFGQPVGPKPLRLTFQLDGRDLKTVEVKETQHQPQADQVWVKLPAGSHHFTVACVDDAHRSADLSVGDAGQKPGATSAAYHAELPGGQLMVQALEIEGPMALPQPLPISHRRIFFGQPAEGNSDACARKILAAFARRAFRRPVTPQEVDRLVGYVHLAENEGDSFERGIQLAVEAVLVSPHFLFRVEVDHHPNDPKAKQVLGPYELASRLSYFLWSSMPDEELFALAAQGRLQDPKVLAAQARRMLKDSRARALAQNFAGQWLQLRRLNFMQPDPKQFPEFNEKLRQAMRAETEKFFQAIVQEDRSVMEFLGGRFTYLNEPLAQLYGIDGVKGEQFRRVVLTADDRGGILRQASVLTVTSNPTRTSPVKRGKWVLEQLLGQSPPPPPPGIPELADDKKHEGPLTGTLRQRFEKHRSDPGCASCHAPMDPIGFGLENYNPIGQWRTKDGGLPIDSSGELPGGKKFNGPGQLIKVLEARKPEFVRNLSEKMLTYALGRGLEASDSCTVDKIAKAVAQDNDRFLALIAAVVQSDPFRQRRGDGGQSS